MGRMPWLAVAAALVLMVGACRSEPTPSPTPEPEVQGQWPSLEALQATVEYREREDDALTPVEPGTPVEEVVAGGNVVVGETGRAELLWPEFLDVDLLRGTDVLLGLSLPSQREVVVDQATGTARYLLQGAGEPANLKVAAAWAEIQVDAGVAEFIVSLVPGVDPVAWLVVLDGQATLSLGPLEDGTTVEVGTGRAIAVSEDGPLPEPVEIDRAAVLAWYDAYADGDTDESLAAVAFRCVVTGTDVALLDAPSAEDGQPLGDPLRQGTVVGVDGRDESGDWLYARSLTARQEGWLGAADVTCVGPVSQLPPVETEEEPEATATATARRVIVVSATPPLVATPTPSATPTGSAAYTIRFWADDDSITFPECTVLRWETENINQVFYQGRGVVGNGSSEECPQKDTTYELRVVLRDGTEQIRTVKVTVKQREPTAAPATATTAPPTTAPPTAAPTTAPPTPEPPTQPPPTDVPPTPEPPTESAPQPTEPRPQP